MQVSTPGAERMLKVPDDLGRFKEMPITVCYEDQDSDSREKTGVFLLDSIEMDSEICVWKLADVKENRDPQEKGRPLSRKQRDWRLNLPFVMHKRVTLYLEYWKICAECIIGIRKQDYRVSAVLVEKVEHLSLYAFKTMLSKAFSSEILIIWIE